MYVRFTTTARDYGHVNIKEPQNIFFSFPVHINLKSVESLTNKQCPVTLQKIWTELKKLY